MRGHPEKHTHRCIMVGKGCSKPPSQHAWEQRRTYRAHCKISFLLPHCCAEEPWAAKCSWLVCLSLWERSYAEWECGTRGAFLLVADGFRVQKESLQSHQERRTIVFGFLFRYQHNCSAKEQDTCTWSHVKVPSSESAMQPHSYCQKYILLLLHSC